MRVKIFSDFTTSENHLTIMKSWGKGLVYKDMEFVADDNFTHAVVINNGRPSLNIPRKNIINFMWEPYQYLDWRGIANWVAQYGGTLVCHSDRLRGPRVKEYIPFLSSKPLHVNHKAPKTKRMSMVASSKKHLDGHKLRHDLIQRILYSDLDIDIYGRDINSHFREDERMKGTIDDTVKAFAPYEYTISIENSDCGYYLTEKFYDPIVCGCVPLYWGSRQATKVFGDASHIQLPISYDVETIFKVIERVYKEGEKKDTQVVEDLLNNKINMPEFLWEHFTTCNF